MTLTCPRRWRLLVPAAALFCVPFVGRAQQVTSPSAPALQTVPLPVLRQRTRQPDAPALAASTTPAPKAPAQPQNNIQPQNNRRRGRRRRLPPKPPIEFVPGGAISSAPVVGSNGFVYLASWNSRVYALDGATGALKWKFTAPKMLNASPAVGADGTVYAGAYDGKVYALDGATGTKRWEFATRSLLNEAPAVSAAGDTVYVGGYDRTVYALAAKDGALKWRTPVGAAASSPTVGSDGAVYVGADEIYALKPADGKPQWQFLTGFDAASPVAASSDGMVYAQAHDDTGRSQICALDTRTGRQNWAFPLSERMAFPPLAVGDRVYVGADQLYALRQSSGHLVWQYGQGSVRWSTPTAYNGIICAGNASGALVALDAATGNVLWTFATNDPLLSFPRFGPDGVVYAACEGDRKVYALQGRTGKIVWQFTQDPVPTAVPPPARKPNP